MQAIALIVVALAGLWLVGVAFLMALRPRYCLQVFEKMSAKLERSNWRLQFTEQGLRVLAGVALIVRAPASKLPLVFRSLRVCELIQSPRKKRAIALKWCNRALRLAVLGLLGVNTATPILVWFGSGWSRLGLTVVGKRGGIRR